MKKSFLITAALAAFGAASAFAQFVASPNDLIVGFQTVGGANNLIIDLGTGVGLGSTDFGNVGSAISGLGAGALTWSVAGTQGALAGTYLPDATFLTRATDPGTVTDLTAKGATSAINTVAGIGQLGTPFTIAGLVGKGAVTYAAANADSYSSMFAAGSYMATEASGLGSSINLYLLNSTVAAVPGTKAKPGTPQGDLASTLLGTFNLSNSGQLTFTAAIPEPSTYAALLGIATLGFVAIRRRKQAAQLVA
jgi:hypothetical protein